MKTPILICQKNHIKYIQSLSEDDDTWNVKGLLSFYVYGSWPAHMSLNYAHARYLKRVEGGVRFPGTEVIVVILHVGAGN